MNIAEFLNTTFYSFDYTILKAFHIFAENGGLILKPFISIFAIFGDSSFGFLVFAILLFFLAKNKKYSYLVACAFFLSVLSNNIIIKNFVARQRPFLIGNEDYNMWWEFAGKTLKGGYSFLSGHTLRAFSCLFSLYLENKNFKYLIFTIIFTFLTIVSRLFFVVHYPSDCLFALLFGVLVAYITYFIITKLQDKLDFILKKILPFAYK